MAQIYSEMTNQILDELHKVVVGKDSVLIWMLGAILAGGHILLEDIPGVGKTTLALAYSKVLGLDYGRVQMNPDILPSDITGFSLPAGDGSSRFIPGSVFCNLFLADELNRATARAQSALLEAMEERQVTVDGSTHPISEPFTVIATQNPLGAAGTECLPDSQLDRFMIRLSLGYPTPAEETALLLHNRGRAALSRLHPILTRQQVCAAAVQIRGTYISDSVAAYLVNLIGATRNHPQLARGASPRATLAAASMAKAMARLQGRDFVIPADIVQILPVTLCHRLQLSSRALALGITAETVLSTVLQATPLPQQR